MNLFESQAINQGKQEKPETDNLSEEFQLKLNEFKEKKQKLNNGVNALTDTLYEARIPYNSLDKKKASDPESGYLEDMGFAKSIKNLQIYIDNESDNDSDPAVCLKNYKDIKTEIEYIYQRFNSLGYLSDKNKGGDILKNDFPEVSEKIDNLMSEISQIDSITVSLDNRLDAQKEFERMGGKALSRPEKCIPAIHYISDNGRPGFCSFDIGTYRNPKELIANLEKFLDDSNKKIEEIEGNDNFNEEEKEKRLKVLQGSIAGGKEYLDEFKRLAESQQK